MSIIPYNNDKSDKSLVKAGEKSITNFRPVNKPQINRNIFYNNLSIFIRKDYQIYPHHF